MWSRFLEEARCSPHPPLSRRWQRTLSVGWGPGEPQWSPFHQQTPGRKWRSESLSWRSEGVRSLFDNVLKVYFHHEALIHAFAVQCMWFCSLIKDRCKRWGNVCILYAHNSQKLTLKKHLPHFGFHLPPDFLQVVNRVSVRFNSNFININKSYLISTKQNHRVQGRRINKYWVTCY